jgi:hypothetical protein
MSQLGYPLIISSYKLFDYCKAKYPGRTVVADMHCAYDHFYYWNRKNNLRLCINKTEIWVGSEWPRIIRVR